VGHGCLARTVRITNDILPGESGDAARGDDLALHVAFAANAIGVGVARVEEVQECDAGVECGHRVEAESCIGVFEGGGSEGLLDIGDRGIAFILGESCYGARDAGVGDEHVDEGCLLLDGGDRCGEGVFGAGVAGDGDDGAVLLRGYPLVWTFGGETFRTAFEAVDSREFMRRPRTKTLEAPFASRLGPSLNQGLGSVRNLVW
jgi:hypothetical protein